MKPLAKKRLILWIAGVAIIGVMALGLTVLVSGGKGSWIDETQTPIQIVSRPASTPIPRQVVQPITSPTMLPEQPQDHDRYFFPPGTLAHPHGLAVISATAWTIDQGKLYSVDLWENGWLRAIPDYIDASGKPMKDLIDLTISPDGQAIWVIDRMGDLFEYHPQRQRWELKRTIADRFSQPSQLYLALATYKQRAYILDEAQGQIWRFPADTGTEGYIPGSDVWARIKAGYDLTRAVDIAIDGNGDVFLLLREEPDKKQPAKVVRYSNNPPTLVWSVTEGEGWQAPTAIWTASNHALFLIGSDGKSLSTLDKETGASLDQVQLPDNGQIRAITIADGELYVLGPNSVYVVRPKGRDFQLESDHPQVVQRPDRVEDWTSLHFDLPVPALHLPDRDSLLPGSPRLYRFGVHEGIDFFGIATGITIERTTPIQVVAPGTIIRIDHDYSEMVPDEYHALLREAESQRNTPPDTEDKLRGRQVWIDHGQGVITRYSHLSSTLSELEVGQYVGRGTIIGYVGNSGTEGGVYGTNDGLHLHFEVRIGDTYLGRWLTSLEVRRLFGQIFGFNHASALLESPFTTSEYLPLSMR